eukprot:Sspe_Gene.35811::Locus_17340_Transcript_4_5_Confidence_0.632_Length_470::g.35811::m.35811
MLLSPSALFHQKQYAWEKVLLVNYEFSNHTRERGSRPADGKKCNHCQSVLWCTSGTRLKRHIALCDKAPASKKKKAQKETEIVEGAQKQRHTSGRLMLNSLWN